MNKTRTKTAWTDERLRRLYVRYNARYWKGKLPEYRVSTETLDNFWGITKDSERLVVVDPTKHPSDKSVRSTLLHEMCHVGAGVQARIAHGVEFFKELERLLRQKAPVSISFPEAGGKLLNIDQIPKQFRLCRRAMKIAIDSDQDWIKRAIAALPPDTPFQELDSVVIGDFEDAARLEGVTWKKALWLIGRQNGLIDIAGTPLPEYQQLLDRAKSVHRRGMKFWHEEKRVRVAFERMKESSEEQ